MNYLGQRNILAKHAPFYYMEKLILHSFNACIVTLLYTQIKNSYNTKSPINIKQYLKSLSPQYLLTVIKNIYIAIFS